MNIDVFKYMNMLERGIKNVVIVIKNFGDGFVQGDNVIEMIEKICPHVGEPCIGLKCSEFVPRHTRIGYYNWGIQDTFAQIYCMLTCQVWVEETHTITVSAHCKINVSSATRWDK